MDNVLIGNFEVKRIPRLHISINKKIKNHHSKIRNILKLINKNLYEHIFNINKI